MTKTYRAETMMEALRMIQQELGADAIVVSARELTKTTLLGGKRKAGVEVVAMRLQPSAPAQPAAPAQPPAPAAKQPSVLRQGQNGKVEFVEDQSQIEWVQEAPAAPAAESKSAWAPARISRQEAAQPQPAKSTAPAAAPQPKTQTDELPGVRPARKPAAAGTVPPPARGITSKALQRIRVQLLSQEVEIAYVDRLLRVAQDSYTPAVLENDSLCRKYFTELMQAEINVTSGATLIANKPVVCLVGASGAGKSTAAARLAMLYTHALGKRVNWICADTLHTGAISEARAYTDALGIPLQLAYTASDLSAAVSAARGADLILVDTAGFNPWDEHQLVELGELLTVAPNRTTLMVASAATKESDLNQAAAALNVFHLDGLIVSKLDETFSSGSVFNFARKSQIPLCYFTFGRLAEGTLQAADAERLTAALFGKGWN
jgi:flagellar biosynthesis protein FlhF